MQCKAKTKSNKRCAAQAVGNTGLCFWHSPAHKRKRDQARKLGGEHRRRGSGMCPLPADANAETVEGLRRIVAAEMRGLGNLEQGVGRARALAYLVTVQKDLIVDGELAERVAKLERLLEDMKNGATQAAGQPAPGGSDERVNQAH